VAAPADAGPAPAGGGVEETSARASSAAFCGGLSGSDLGCASVAFLRRCTVRCTRYCLEEIDDVGRLAGIKKRISISNVRVDSIILILRSIRPDERKGTTPGRYKRMMKRRKLISCVSERAYMVARDSRLSVLL
jgi:hypothetical protein